MRRAAGDAPAASYLKTMRESELKRQPLMLCVADVDTRLVCNAVCVTCAHYMPDRRRDERRATPRRTLDRRIMSRHF
jgi:hypothetical protein